MEELGPEESREKESWPLTGRPGVAAVPGGGGAMPVITKEQLQDLHYVQGLTEEEIASRFGVTRTTIASYRMKYGFIPRRSPKFPRCPRCGATTNFLRDEGLGFCPVCLVRVDVKGRIVEMEVEA